MMPPGDTLRPKFRTSRILDILDGGSARLLRSFAVTRMMTTQSTIMDAMPMEALLRRGSTMGNLLVAGLRWPQNRDRT